jgi:hypothetical protein
VTRLTIELAVATGISPDIWADQGWRGIKTAIEVLNKQNEKEDPEGRQMSG